MFLLLQIANYILFLCSNRLSFYFCLQSFQRRPRFPGTEEGRGSASYCRERGGLARWPQPWGAIDGFEQGSHQIKSAFSANSYSHLVEEKLALPSNFFSGMSTSVTCTVTTLRPAATVFWRITALPLFDTVSLKPLGYHPCSTRMPNSHGSHSDLCKNMSAFLSSCLKRPILSPPHLE